MKHYERYNNLRNFTKDLTDCFRDNDIVFLKLEALKELLENEIKKHETEKSNNDYCLGLYDGIAYIQSKINKIIDK